MTWISPLRRAGVELICIVQGQINWDDFASRMIFQITQEGKNQFLVSLSNNVMRGMLKQARDGDGKRRTPYGYDLVYFDEAGNEMHRVVAGARFSKPKGWKAKLAVSVSIAPSGSTASFTRVSSSEANSIRFESRLVPMGTRIGGGRDLIGAEAEADEFDVVGHSHFREHFGAVFGHRLKSDAEFDRDLF